MRIILTAVLFLAGLFNLFLGVSFLLDPARLGAAFNLDPVGPGGLAVLRATSVAFSTSYARFESTSLSYCLTVASQSMPTPQLFCSQ